MSDAEPPRYSGYGIPVDQTGGAADGIDPNRLGRPRRTDDRRRWIIGGTAAVVAVLAVVALVLWVARTPLGVVARAVTATLEQESATTRVDATVVGIPLVGDVNLVVAEGEVDFTSGEARFSRQFFGGVATELRYSRDGVFLQVPFAEDRWVALAQNDPALDSLPPDVTSVAPGLGNPVALLGMLRALESTPTEVGREQAAGLPVTVYEVMVDLDATADLLGEEGRDVITRLRRLTGGGELPLLVAIDDDGLIRSVRFTTRVPLSPTFEFSVDNAIVFTDFGVPVDVSAPPEDRIVELDASVLRGLDPLGAIRELLEGIPLPGGG